METNVLAAVRVQPLCEAGPSVVQTLQYGGVERQETNSLAAVQVDSKTVPVSFAFGPGTRQETLYTQMLAPFMSSFLEGFDVSIVTYGQKGSGKSYTCFGNGVGCLANESDYGLCQRFVRELFQCLAKKVERTCRISISWTEIGEDDEQVVDLLNNLGLVQCFALKDCFDWMQIGSSARNPENHNIFTLILEQQWITDNGYNQHKLSTLSFCDLCSTERRFVTNELNQNISVPRNFSLQALEHSILSNVDPTYISHESNLFSQSSLPTLLKDSFGGRAQTIFMLCVSPRAEDLTETIFNLDFAYKAQMVMNFVFMNAFTDNNVPIDSLFGQNQQTVDADFRNNNENVSTSQRFAMQQWLKLLQNAEGLFSKIVLTQNMDGKEWVLKRKLEKKLFYRFEARRNPAN